MKNLLFIFILAPFVACTQQNLSPSETAQIVAESFYSGNNDKLKEYTTPTAYNNFMSIQQMFINDSINTSFEEIQKIEQNDIVWIKYSTNHEKRPSVFKLVQQEGKWRVTDKGIHEKTPF